MKILFAVLVLALAVSPSFAQATYSMPAGKTFTCDKASYYPITKFSQFTCRGIQLADSTGAVVGSFFFYSSGEIYISVPGISGVDVYDSRVTKDPTVPLGDPFTFSWTAEDGSGVYHNGTATAQWYSKQFCGGKACWYAPVLTSFEVSVE